MAELSHIRSWVFDLDNTLYSAANHVFAEMDARMADFVARFLGVPLDEATRVQKEYYARHGTTLKGLMSEHGMAPDAFRRLTTRAFNEMRAAGITCVGEFHYLHHADGDDYAFDALVLEAAREAGIRIVLLNAYYATGGIGRPLEDAQLRFRSKDPDAYWAQMDRLVPFCEGPERWLGAVVHSVRAASQKDLASVYAGSLCVAASAAGAGLLLYLHQAIRRKGVLRVRLGSLEGIERLMIRAGALGLVHKAEPARSFRRQVDDARPDLISARRKVPVHPALVPPMAFPPY